MILRKLIFFASIFSRHFALKKQKIVQFYNTPNVVNQEKNANYCVF